MECSKCEDGTVFELCNTCNGSGEGMHDGSICLSCNGVGEHRYYCTCDEGADLEVTASEYLVESYLDGLEDQARMEYENSTKY
jgi:hypothetical protein